MVGEDFLESEEENKAAFNMAFAYLERINRLISFADIAALNFNLEEWFSILKTIHREISQDISDKEAKDINEKISAIYPLRNESMKFSIRGYNAPKKIANDLYMKLEDLEISLRKLLGKYGYLMPKIGDARTAIYGRK